MTAQLMRSDASPANRSNVASKPMANMMRATSFTFGPVVTKYKMSPANMTASEMAKEIFMRPTLGSFQAERHGTCFGAKG